MVNVKTTTKKVRMSHEEKELKTVNEQIYERNLELSIRNRTLSLTRKMYEIMNTSLGVRETSEKLISSIVHELQFKGGSIALIDKKARVLSTIASTNSNQKKDETSIMINKITQKPIPLRYENNLYIQTISTKRRKVTHDFHDLVAPIIEKNTALDIQEKINIHTFILYPIMFADDVFGVLTLAMDKKVGDFSRGEREALKEVINLVGIAVERAQIYADLKTANKKLKELDKMKDDFVSVASHELRTPMTAIKSYLWMTINGKGGKVSKKQKFYLDRAYNSTDRLIKLVNDMLNISRIESGRITIELNKVDPVAMTQEVIDAVKPRADEVGVSVEIGLDQLKSAGIGKKEDDKEIEGIKNKLKSRFQQLSEIPAVLADADKIKEVLFNLIGNSLKFTDKGGNITVFFTKEEDRIVFHIKDTGRGIDENDMPTLFTKFGMVEGSYATNKKASGTGLGLFISKSIVELHYGNIDVVSEGIEKGTTVSFSLPLYKSGDAKVIKPKKSKENRTLGIVHSGL